MRLRISNFIKTVRLPVERPAEAMRLRRCLQLRLLIKRLIRVVKFLERAINFTNLFVVSTPLLELDYLHVVRLEEKNILYAVDDRKTCRISSRNASTLPQYRRLHRNLSLLCTTRECKVIHFAKLPWNSRLTKWGVSDETD